MSPLVSVVIPTYNRGHCIEECIRSVQMQGYADIDVIVVDDASGDDTRERVARIGDPRLRYIAHEYNRGGAAARNTGICAARGSYIAFLDSDDRWTHDKLEKQMRGLLAQGPECGFSYTWLLCVDDEGRESASVSTAYEGDCRRRILVSNFVGSFSNVVIRRDLLELVGCLDETMRSCQDWDLFIRLLRLTRVHCQRDYLVHYRQSSDDGVRISLNPRAVVQGHRRIRQKFADEYLAMPREQRCEALRAYFNAFAGIGAFGEALKMCGAMLIERVSPLEWPHLSRGLARAAKTAARRTWNGWRVRKVGVGSAAR
ncbi:MAG: glycosyltransferase family 2 protein [Rugosibacter sp.]